MNRKVYLGILTFVTVACIIFGSLYHITGFGEHIFRVWPGKYVAQTNDRQETTAISDITFQSIDIDVDVTDLEIVRGDRFQVSWNYTDDNEPQVNVENDTLVVTQKSRLDLLHFSLVNLHRQNAHLTITVPADVTLKDVYIKADVGDLDITGMAAASCDIYANVGDVDLTSVQVDNLVIQSDVGDVDVARCAFQTLTIDADVGDVDISGITALDEYTVDLTTDLGEIEVLNRDQGTRYHAVGSTDKTITVQTDTGEIDIE